jgi:hypothetical protein
VCPADPSPHEPSSRQWAQPSASPDLASDPAATRPSKAAGGQPNDRNSHSTSTFRPEVAAWPRRSPTAKPSTLGNFGRLAQRESAAFTRQRPQVRNLQRPRHNRRSGAVTLHRSEGVPASREGGRAVNVLGTLGAVVVGGLISIVATTVVNRRELIRAQRVTICLELIPAVLKRGERVEPSDVAAALGDIDRHSAIAGRHESRWAGACWAAFEGWEGTLTAARAEIFKKASDAETLTRLQEAHSVASMQFDIALEHYARWLERKIRWSVRWPRARRAPS